MASTERYLKLKYNTTGEDITLKSVGDTIQYYVSGHRYALLDDVYKKKKANGKTQAATLKDYFNDIRPTDGAKTDLYKIVENEYVLIEPSETYDDNIYYYIIDGTAEENCYLCDGDGTITVTPEGDKDKSDEEYPCPKCKGKKKLYHTTQAVSILGVTISQNAMGPTGYSVRYKVVPYGETKSTIVNHEDIYTPPPKQNNN